MNFFFFFAISASYAMDDVGGGACEVIGNFNGSFRSRYFLSVVLVQVVYGDSCVTLLVRRSWAV